MCLWGITALTTTAYMINVLLFAIVWGFTKRAAADEAPHYGCQLELEALRAQHRAQVVSNLPALCFVLFVLERGGEQMSLYARPDQTILPCLLPLHMTSIRVDCVSLCGQPTRCEAWPTNRLRRTHRLSAVSEVRSAERTQ